MSDNCISEDFVRCLPDATLNILLKDHTRSREGEHHNIFWMTSDYEVMGHGYGYHDEISPMQAKEEMNGIYLIGPRLSKARDTQRDRSRDRAEVFTPAWICNAQNNLIDSAWFGRDDVFNHENPDHTWTVNPEPVTFPDGKTWTDYVRDTRLEITCGEAPYAVSRYDVTTGQPIDIDRRIGLIDRKLRIVGEHAKSSAQWLDYAQEAYKHTYGYEWQGDSLFIAREQLLLSFVEYYCHRFGRLPMLKSINYIAYIISWNFWQMDGLRCVVPDSCGCKPTGMVNFFGEAETAPCRGCATDNLFEHNGTYCLIRDWGASKGREKKRFVDLLKRRP